MTELRLHTLPGIKIPPPYHITAGGGDDCFSIIGGQFKLSPPPPLSPIEESIRAAISTYEGVYDELVAFLRAGIKPTGAEWVDHWIADERIETFRDHFDTLRSLERKIIELIGDEVDERRRNDENAHRCRETISSVIPVAEEQLHFAESTLARAFRLAARLVRTPVADDKRARDSELASQFNWATSWALIAMNTLLIATDDDDASPPVVVTEHFLGSVLGAMRQFAVDASHFAREGRRLREEGTAEAEQELPSADDQSIGDDDLLDAETSISLEETRGE